MGRTKGSGQSLSLALFDKTGTTRAGTWGKWFALPVGALGANLQAEAGLLSGPPRFIGAVLGRKPAPTNQTARGQSNVQQLSTTVNNCQQLSTTVNNCQQLSTTVNECTYSSFRLHSGSSAGNPSQNAAEEAKPNMLTQFSCAGHEALRRRAPLPTGDASIGGAVGR
ncbi:hypothetical protein E4U58_007307 [Claviceps cyperi]|nr:hypothetical protein E4U58_007307 [Claviceps cyperi]